MLAPVLAMRNGVFQLVGVLGGSTVAFRELECGAYTGTEDSIVRVTMTEIAKCLEFCKEVLA